MENRLRPNPYGPDAQNPHQGVDQYDDLKVKAQSTTTTQDEKRGLDGDGDDDDINKLILELQDETEQAHEEEEKASQPASARPVPDELLQTDPRYGLSDSEVQVRRKRFGWNKMKEEKVNLFLKFLSYFIGPIQFVMEVSDSTDVGLDQNH